VNALVTLATELAEQLPATDVRRLADACRSGASGLAALESSSAGIPMRTACRRLAAAETTERLGEYAAGLLIGAAESIRRQRAAQSVDVAWTGPQSTLRTSRLTAAVVSELVDTAEREVLLVSYAAHPTAQLLRALHRATTRGVTVTLVLERPTDNRAYTATGEAFPDLDATRWVWPAAHRPPGAALHAKIIVVDRRIALVGSANLTGRAFETNLECGILLRDGIHPAAIHQHIELLHASGQLSSVTPH
jgi:phosphatidylserine/phosphatidylglycerophosphate/cardiolipin synthase-like enzyme